LVSAPAEERLRRVLLRDEQRSADQVREIMEKQLSDVEKRKVADVEIHNDNRHSVIEQVLKVRATLEKMSTGLQL
jgi:dephospho-CoA kinase